MPVKDRVPRKLDPRLAIHGGEPVRKRPFAPHPVLGPEERRGVLSVLKTGQLSGFVAKPGDAFLGGAQVRQLENAVRRRLGCRHAVAMNSATSSLHAAVVACGIEPGDEVIVPPYTMSASASAVLMAGGIPVFADVDPVRYCLDPADVERRIGPRTRAILVVHLFGHPAPMDRLRAIARKRSLWIIEDCAQAPGAMYKGRPVGTLGDVGVYSLNQHKTITTGEGGWAITANPKLALKMQLVRNHGEVVQDHLPEADFAPVLGWNYRMTELEAAVGVAQLAKLDALTRHRVRLAEYLTGRLRGLSGLSLPEAAAGCTHVYFVYPIRYDAALTGIPRDIFLKALAAEGIPFAGGYVRPIYREPIYRKRRMYERSGYPFDLQKGANVDNYREGSCPVAEDAHARSLIMTGLCRYPLTRADMDDIAHAVIKVLRQRRVLGGPS